MQLTHRRLLLLRETEPFFQIVGTDPGFRRRSLPFTCTERVKQSLVKWREHMPNNPFRWKCFLCWLTNLFHVAYSLLVPGEVWIDIPNSLSATLSQCCTTQRLGGILHADFSLKTRLTSHKQYTKLATLSRCEYDVTSERLNLVPTLLTTRGHFWIE